MKQFMKSSMTAIFLVAIATTTVLTTVIAAPAPPSISHKVEGQNLSISWTKVPRATSYTLHYAPYPYTGPESINQIELPRGTTAVSYELWDGAAYYFAVTSSDPQGESDYSNIEHFAVGTPPGVEEPETPEVEEPETPAVEEPEIPVVEEPAGVTTTKLVDTALQECYNATQSISCPNVGGDFYGQDAQYSGLTPSYRNNNDGTVTDLNTGLMWQQNPGDKMTYATAVNATSASTLGGYSDWRLPTIKELYSLMRFDGVTGMSEADSTPYIDTDYFDFSYGDTSVGERMIDAQYLTSTFYVSTTMNGDETLFGVNFADGRIKGYGTTDPRSGAGKTFFVLMVRGDEGYGVNTFVDNSNGAISDLATGLMWRQNDSGSGMNWQDSLDYCEEMSDSGYSDWRLPNAKELQGIVDYTRSPATTNSAAIDPMFNVSSITDEGGGSNYPFYWTSTTHLDGLNKGEMAAYIAFGEALGWMQGQSGNYELLDVHGAGCQRSDPKIGDPDDYPYGFGPQGDVRRIYNHVRCVRNIE